MNSALLLALNSLSLLLNLQGKTAEANVVNLLASAALAGVNIDSAMAVVAEKIKSGESFNWQDLRGRIEADSAVLHSA